MSKRNNRTQPADQVQTLLDEFEIHRQLKEHPQQEGMEIDGEEIDGAVQG